MKLKLYTFLTLFMLVMAACSSDDDDKDVAPEPGLQKSYVSRVKVTDLNAPGSDAKTLKLYYDSEKRITGVHWGTTVPNRLGWKFVYGSGKMDIAESADVPGTQRCCTFDGTGRIESIAYASGDVNKKSSYTYTENNLTNISETIAAGQNTSTTVSDFVWQQGNITDITTRLTHNGSDSLVVTSRILYDEIAPNSTNIDLNILLDALNGIFPQYPEAPMLLKLCGASSSQLVLSHTQTTTHITGSASKDTLSYQVLSYSMQQGRLSDIETFDENRGKHLKISIIYKSEK